VHRRKNQNSPKSEFVHVAGANGLHHVCPRLYRLLFLEHFPAKWTPVRVKKMRQNKGLEIFSDSIRSEKALAGIASPVVSHENMRKE
jgi:hypothetical protein